MKLTTLGALLIMQVACFSVANADPYYQWSEHVQKASKGLQICVDTYAEAIGSGRSSAELKKQMANADQTCATLKNYFNATMLTVRQNVNGMDDALSSYHRQGMAGFDEMVPKQGQSPLAYQADALEKVLAIQKQLSRLHLQNSR